MKLKIFINKFIQIKNALKLIQGISIAACKENIFLEKSLLKIKFITEL